MRYVLALVLALVAIGGLLFGTVALFDRSVAGAAVAYPLLLLGTVGLGALTICAFVERASEKQCELLGHLVRSSIAQERQLDARIRSDI